MEVEVSKILDTTVVHCCRNASHSDWGADILVSLQLSQTDRIILANIYVYKRDLNHLDLYECKYELIVKF